MQTKLTVHDKEKHSYHLMSVAYQAIGETHDIN